MFQLGFMFSELPRPFNMIYKCYSVALLPGNERHDVERGGKIIMPSSALEQLTRLNIIYPMLFKLTNRNNERVTHCGVLEFVADEGRVYLPLWMMHNMVLNDGDSITIESAALPIGTFSKFQPLSVDFLDITNPKAVLENCLRSFACLTTGDVIAVTYNQKVYELCVLETKPGNAISIIECDMNVEFAPPVGYKEPEINKLLNNNNNDNDNYMNIDSNDIIPEPIGFVAFRGIGNRLDGKKRKDTTTNDTTNTIITSSSSLTNYKQKYIRGIPDYDYQIGTLKFIRRINKKSDKDIDDDKNEFKAFSGAGFSLKK